MSEPNPKQQLITFWILWIGLFSAIFAYQFALGGGIPEGEDSEEPLNMVIPILAIGHILIATCIRWLFIPKAKTVMMLFILFVIGICLSEFAVLVEIFLIPSEYPETKLTIFILSVLGTFQFIPTYAKSVIEPSRESMRDNRFA